MNKFFVILVCLVAIITLVYASAASEKPVGTGITVVLDPAFGGKETGAVGLYKLTEKEVVLDVALKVKDYIEKNDPAIKIYLTRTKDEAVSQKEREKFIQDHSPALVVRLRFNSSKRKDMNGFSVRCNKGNKESKRFAEIISAEMSDIFVKDLVSNEGIKPAEIYRDVQVPAVEVFLGYITSPDIEANFRQPKIKEAIAESIGKAITQYLNGHKGE